MSNKTISILGSGWLGLPLSDLLVKEGHQIHLSSRSTDKITRLKAKKKQLFKLLIIHLIFFIIQSIHSPEIVDFIPTKLILFKNSYLYEINLSLYKPFSLIYFIVINVNKI